MQFWAWMYLRVHGRLPTAAARVRSQVRSCGICGGQSGTEAGFLLVLRFPLPILIPPTTPHSSSSIIRGWYNRPNIGRRTKWTQSTSGRSFPSIRRNDLPASSGSKHKPNMQQGCPSNSPTRELQTRETCLKELRKKKISN
jgi:hypothetical protein